MIQMTEPKLIVRDTKLHYSFVLDGQRIRKALNLSNTAKNRNLVKSIIFPQLTVDVLSGKFFKKQIQTLDEYSNVSFENHRLERKPMTTHDYINIYNRHISPYFGKTKLDEISVSDINQWKNTLFGDKGLSSKRVNIIKKVFGTILNDSVEDEIISTNPIRKSKALPSHQIKDIEPFSLTEINKILNACEGQNKHIIATLFFTGMRTGECIGLKWSDIDFDKRIILIRRTIGRGVEGLPKTHSSIRAIDMADILWKHLKNQFSITSETGTYVFLNQIGTHYFDSSKLRDRMWKKTLANAQVRYRTIYQTRHTFCSLNLQNGEDILWISRMMGHSTPKTTLERYSKYIPRETKRTSVFDNM
ncbi:MAG: site-specific integrase [Sulfuricurvum sp.]|nr:site-specific integrase [Sulfuricurvum sp.]